MGNYKRTMNVLSNRTREIYLRLKTLIFERGSDEESIQMIIGLVGEEAHKGDKKIIRDLSLICNTEDPHSGLTLISSTIKKDLHNQPYFQHLLNVATEKTLDQC